MVLFMSLCRLSTSTSSTSSTLTSTSAAALALASALLSRARVFSSSPPPPPPLPKKKPKTSGAALKSLALYRSALRAARLQPSPESKQLLAETARSLIEKSRKVDSQTAEHLQRRGVRQLELVRSGAAVLGTVKVD